MDEPRLLEITKLLALASDVKTRLRALETEAMENARGGLAASEVRASHFARTRSHLELALEALGAPLQPFAGAGLNGLEITGFHSASIFETLHELRSQGDESGSADSETAEAAGTAPDKTKPSDGPAEPSGAKVEAGEPSVWVKNRVDEIQRALSFALGEDDAFGEESAPDEPEAPDSAAAPDLDPPQFTGNTDALSVPELVGFFQAQEKTGVLSIDGPDEQFTLEYRKGELIHAGSSCSPPGERLGEILVHLGHMTAEELQSLLADKSGAERLGDVLRRGETIPEEALAEALQVQVQRIFHRLFDVRGCQFAFREGLRGEPSERVRYNITRLLLETARHRDEQRMAG